jgi:DNA topoisomerase-3
MKTLLQDLTRVAKYVTDPKVRELLLDKDADKSEEAGGIGTPATRDSHIETLFKRGYIIEKKKNIISTDVGQAFHDALPGFATKPDMTALWHEKQKQIEAGTLTAEDLEKEVAEAVADEISRLKSDGMNLKPADLPKCPNCETGHLKRRKGAKGFFWGCTNYPECKTTFPDKNGKPDQAAKKSLKPSEHACPECGKGLIRRPGKKKGSFWWGCSGFPSCKYTTFDKDGKPEIKQ